MIIALMFLAYRFCIRLYIKKKGGGMNKNSEFHQWQNNVVNYAVSLTVKTSLIMRGFFHVFAYIFSRIK